jgi:hypothetical protein
MCVLMIRPPTRPSHAAIDVYVVDDGAYAAVVHDVHDVHDVAAAAAVVDDAVDDAYDDAVDDAYDDAVDDAYDPTRPPFACG